MWFRQLADRRPRPVWWVRHRRARKAATAYLEAVCAADDRREVGRVLVIHLAALEREAA